MAEEKTYAKKTNYIHFIYRGPRDQWYPRSIHEELVDEKTDEWDEEGIEYKEVTKEEMVSQGAKLDLGGDFSEDIIRKAQNIGN